MIPQMPRGAIPLRRSELAAADPYRPDTSAEVFVPSGAFPTPGHELAAARPYKARGTPPGAFLAWASPITFGEDETASASFWSEEAFAKSCADPNLALSAETVLSTARTCGSSNFAEFMQTRGFRVGGTAYLDGPFFSVDWTNTAVLKHAIAGAGPVKVGIASLNLTAWPHGRITPGTNGWALYGLPAAEPQDHCASLCGYGSLAALMDVFDHHGVEIAVPAGMPSDLCYALSIWGSIGILDHQSLLNITGEAWVRQPTTILQLVQP